MFGSTQTIILFFLSGTSAIIGNTLLKSGMNQIKTLDLSVSSFVSLATNWQILVGFGLYGASSILYLKLLSSTDLTRAYPALVAYMSLAILFVGAIFLKEPLTVFKLLGALAIVGGIFLLSR